MKRERWNDLMTFSDAELTEEEIKEGWHWCHDFDGLLVGPDMEEIKHCNCKPSPTETEEKR